MRRIVRIGEEASGFARPIWCPLAIMRRRPDHNILAVLRAR